MLIIETFWKEIFGAFADMAWLFFIFMLIASAFFYSQYFLRNVLFSRSNVSDIWHVVYITNDTFH